MIGQCFSRTFFGFSPLGTLAPLARAVAGAANPSNCIIAFQGDLSPGNTVSLAE
jgi:hypothetical protein